VIIIINITIIIFITIIISIIIIIIIGRGRNCDIYLETPSRFDFAGSISLSCWGKFRENSRTCKTR
jgi:hypothetical protein